MLVSQEEVMVFMKERAMERSQCLPLFVVQKGLTSAAGVNDDLMLALVDFRAFGLHHDEARVDVPHLRFYELSVLHVMRLDSITISFNFIELLLQRPSLIHPPPSTCK